MILWQTIANPQHVLRNREMEYWHLEIGNYLFLALSYYQNKSCRVLSVELGLMSSKIGCWAVYQFHHMSSCTRCYTTGCKNNVGRPSVASHICYWMFQLMLFQLMLRHINKQWSIELSNGSFCFTIRVDRRLTKTQQSFPQTTTQTHNYTNMSLPGMLLYLTCTVM